MLLLPINHIRQRQPGECLAACAAMALDHLNIAPDYESLVELLRIRDFGGWVRDLHRLETLGVKVFDGQGELSDRRQSLEQGLPPIVLVDTAQLPYWAERSAHAVLVFGTDDNLVYLNDPEFAEAPQQVTTGDFELA